MKELIKCSDKQSIMINHRRNIKDIVTYNEIYKRINNYKKLISIIKKY